MKVLSMRLSVVLSLIPQGGVVADVGCDHGLLSVAIAQDKRWQGVIAMDISRDAVEKARAQLAPYFDVYAHVRQSNGLSALLEGEARTVVMAGMGGMLMVELLNAGQDKLQGAALVLQPQGSAVFVRVWLHRHGYAVRMERLVQEDGWWYEVMLAVPGIQGYADEAGYLLGHLQDEPLWPAYLKRLKKRFSGAPDVIETMQAAGRSALAARQLALVRAEMARISRAFAGASLP